MSMHSPSRDVRRLVTAAFVALAAALVGISSAASYGEEHEPGIAALRERGAGARIVEVGQSPYIEVTIVAAQWQGRDEDYDLFAKLRQPIVLDLSKAAASPAALGRLAAAGKLKKLNLAGASLGDAQFEQIGRLAQLEVLQLDHARFDSQSLRHLSGLKSLRTLTLADTQVDDSGLAPLAGLKKLQLVMLLRPRVSDEGAATLRQALPDASIVK